LAQRYEQFLGAGVRIAGVSVDAPGQHAAMIDKLRLPFWMLSDPDGEGVLKAVDAWNPDTARHGDIGRPGVVIIDPDGVERFRLIGADFADRISEDDLLAQVTVLELPPTEQPELELAEPEPGDSAMPVRALPPYLRGARFAATAMGLRHEEVKATADAYVEQLDRYAAAIRALREATGS
jgi:hypothetical protein